MPKPSASAALRPLDQSSLLVSALAVRERYREEYWRRRDPILDDRLFWRAQTFRHTVHLLPGQTILELGCGELRFTRALLQVSRNKNPITAVTFQNSTHGPFERKRKRGVTAAFRSSWTAERPPVRLHCRNGPARPG